jgi:cysteinyl-tRNA synthetase
VLKLYNTRTRQKQEFRPLDPKNVRMYVCGPTVYDYAHIGNARPIIVFDVLFRLLRHLYGPEHVTYVRNITDVDDKINARAAEEGISIRELTERTTAQFHADVAALGCLPPTHEPRATEYVAKPDAPMDMIRMIQRLIERGHAYEAQGHVLFAVASDPNYGKLARRSLDEMRAGARVEVAPYKRDPMDFVLWKPSQGAEPGWDSPWGFGRPGWHLECSAMSAALLGETFDIHGGGIDLVFPHHENEVAQSTCAHGTDIMANIWMHNGFLQVEGEKMSKSLGNFITINQLLTEWQGKVWFGTEIRLAMLRTHYRQPIDWTFDALIETRKILDKWTEATSKVEASKVPEEFYAALCDDVNSPACITILHGLHRVNELEKLKACLEFFGIKTRSMRRLMDIGHIKRDWEQIQKQAAEKGGYVGPIMAKSKHRYVEVKPYFRYRTGSLDGNEIDWLKQTISAEDLNNKVVQRAEARRAKNWAEADRIRDELAAMGITLKDKKNPETGEIETEWEIAR